MKCTELDITGTTDAPFIGVGKSGRRWEGASRLSLNVGGQAREDPEGPVEPGSGSAPSPAAAVAADVVEQLQAIWDDDEPDPEDALAERVAERVLEGLRHAMPGLTTAMAETGLAEPVPVLLTVVQAASLLGCSINSLRKRIARRQLGACVVHTGGSVRLHRERLLASLERKATVR